MLSSVAPRLLPPSLALAAVLVVVMGFWAVWPSSWDDAAPAPAPAPVSRPVFDAPLAGVAALEQPLVMTPFVEDGVPRGFVLGAVREGSLFARMGLMEGDVLLGFHDLGVPGAPQLVAHIERAGRSLRVEYSVAPRGSPQGDAAVDENVPARVSARTRFHGRSAPLSSSSLSGRTRAAR